MNIIRRNNVKIYGKGQQAIIFAHGFGCNQNMWRLVAPAFAEDYQIVLFDYVGAGGSDTAAYNRSRYLSLHGYAEDVVEICRALDLEKSIFVGHSVSSMIGLLAATKAPEFFERLVMVGPSPCYINDQDYKGGFDKQTINQLLASLDSNFQSWSASMAPVIMGNSERPELAEELVQSFCGTKPEIARDFAQVTFLSDSRPDLPHFKLETLILQCSEDRIAPEEVGRFLEGQLQKSEIVFLKAKGHCPHVSAPDETVAAIKSFLRRNVRASA